MPSRPSVRTRRPTFQPLENRLPLAASFGIDLPVDNSQISEIQQAPVVSSNVTQTQGSVAARVTATDSGNGESTQTVTVTRTGSALASSTVGVQVSSGSSASVGDSSTQSGSNGGQVSDRLAELRARFQARIEASRIGATSTPQTGGERAVNRDSQSVSVSTRSDESGTTTTRTENSVRDAVFARFATSLSSFSG